VCFKPVMVLLIPAMALAQELPAGTVIPVMIGSSLNAKKDRVGKKLEGRVMQEVPLPYGRRINERSRITAHVVSVTKPGSSGSRIVVKFDTIHDDGRKIPATAALLALASTRHTWLEGSSALIKLTPNPEAGCPGGPGYDREQATWIFSSTACGAYRVGDVKIGNSGATPPLGEIALISSRNVAIHGGTAWLLIVVAE